MAFYQSDGITLHCADAREVIASVEAEALITDPVWPDCEHIFPGIDAEKLLATVLEYARVKRVVIQLSCASDVRFLRAVPARFPFLRVCWLEYACPTYQGRILNTGDVAYVFGEPPTPRKGAMLMPGKKTATRTTSDDWRAIAMRKQMRKHKERGRAEFDSRDHPTPRRYEHVAWLVKWFGGASVVDPFAGSGTTLVAAKRQGVPATGIEISEHFCEIARRRFAQGVLSEMYEGSSFESFSDDEC